MSIQPIPETRIPVTIRQAMESDKDGMSQVTRNIWDGNDYVPFVWDEWLADSEGLLCVAEHDGQMVGLGKLTYLGGDNWWMEGMRVQPEYEGHGIAAQIHDYMVNYWLENGSGTVRLTTSHKRYPIHHLCERSGFNKISERMFFAAPALQADSAESLPFQHVTKMELPYALDFLEQAPLLAYSNGLIDLGWRHALPRLEYLENQQKDGKLWWWRGREGLLSYWEDEEDEVKTPVLSFLGCRVENTPKLLQDSRRLADSLHYPTVSWMAPLQPELKSALTLAGFNPEWDETLYLYAREHPGKLPE